MRDFLGILSIFVIATTFLLFSIALFTKGFKHDLLLEAGVFLVSMKLILMAYKNNVANRTILKELGNIKKELQKKEN